MEALLHSVVAAPAFVRAVTWNRFAKRRGIWGAIAIFERGGPGASQVIEIFMGVEGTGKLCQ